MAVEALIMPGADRAKNDAARLIPEIGSGMLGALLFCLSLIFLAHPSGLAIKHGRHLAGMERHVAHTGRVSRSIR
ncbi:hypothetical protein Tasa_007_008 [Tanticharoenia sakaeratensis NBRC 103193]|uniref:Uncharacterized protein n=1 Tax=Tanticharoenia sakaeratensis NBRC 103193 TaxID=1231623 RepID=A0A0D6MIQ5_9PROT|nr:hypothetical protein Tasa_007_008 [Tanticharoenia sakaeratensis NBRC 103193]GBQ23902.1 hypothetical protein AA103193_2567 [Tanticharoenia sakaeratensis NBRC 103193]